MMKRRLGWTWILLVVLPAYRAWGGALDGRVGHPDDPATTIRPGDKFHVDQPVDVPPDTDLLVYSERHQTSAENASFPLCYLHLKSASERRGKIGVRDLDVGSVQPNGSETVIFHIQGDSIVDYLSCQSTPKTTLTRGKIAYALGKDILIPPEVVQPLSAGNAALESLSAPGTGCEPGVAGKAAKQLPLEVQPSAGGDGGHVVHPADAH